MGSHKLHFELYCLKYFEIRTMWGSMNCYYCPLIIRCLDLCTSLFSVLYTEISFRYVKKEKMGQRDVHILLTEMVKTKNTESMLTLSVQCEYKYIVVSVVHTQVS